MLHHGYKAARLKLGSNIYAMTTKAKKARIEYRIEKENVKLKVYKERDRNVVLWCKELNIECHDFSDLYKFLRGDFPNKLLEKFRRAAVRKNKLIPLIKFQDAWKSNQRLTEIPFLENSDEMD